MNSIVHNSDCLEQWNPIESAQGLYLISSFGNVKSLRSNQIMVPLKGTTGYLNIQLSINGKKINHRIHRLVAEAFLPNSDSKACVNHKDGDKHNNRIENLEWATHSENLIHAYQSGLNRSEREINRLDLQGNLEKTYRSAREAEKDGFSNQLIAKCCLGKRKTHKSKIWQYA